MGTIAHLDSKSLIRKKNLTHEKVLNGVCSNNKKMFYLKKYVIYFQTAVIISFGLVDPCVLYFMYCSLIKQSLFIGVTGIFTVMCYNVLCDKYATRQMYGYCPSWALEWDYRKKGILDEIRHYSADIISLQASI